MALLLSVRDLSKSYGASPLFRSISFNISEGERWGVIGPNGSGKSTLIEIVAGMRQADAGEVVVRKGVRLSYVAQDSQFQAGDTAAVVVRRALARSNVPDSERARLEYETLGRAGFTDATVLANTLSGGWRKRLAIAEALVANPDILLLDEPTNHLDLAGIEWLEQLLRGSRFASVIISHDRYFLENVANEMLELNRVYPKGLLRASGNYSAFLEKKSEFFTAEAKRQDALENRVRTEIEWLRSGPKARATKAKARIDKANELIGELKDSQARSRSVLAGIDFAATDRATKRLLHLERVSYSFGNLPIVRGLNFTLTAGMRVGLVGPNGSGKTTLLRLMKGDLEPQAGTITRAHALRFVYFEQSRVLDPEVSVRRILAPDGDSVVYGDRPIHVASWAARFRFTAEQLNQTVGRLSGGEKACLSIARLMLQPADVLLLDEPTNDLDIPTLEVLEENLTQYPGALVLVTHDRFMLDRVSTSVLGLDGQGNAEQFAAYSQWESWMAEQSRAAIPASKEADFRAEPVRSAAKKKLSYLDSRDWETIESRIADAESVLAIKRTALEDMAVVSDARRLQTAVDELADAQAAVDQLYARWANLEEKMSGLATTAAE